MTDNAKNETKTNEGGGGGCPMKRPEGGYTFNPMAYFRGKKNPHLSVEKPLIKDSSAPTASVETVATNDNSSGGGCPIKSTNQTKAAPAPSNEGGGGCPIKQNNNTPQNNSGGCPIKDPSSQQQYNVYSQPIDPTNNMPSSPHSNLPAPFQSNSLSTNRVSSNIPKGGTDDGATWTYPSPQMFYNSLARKNKLGDTTEDDIESVVALHNNMNEKTWYKVLQWEDLLSSSSSSSSSEQKGELGGGIKLSRFQGRPSDLSPKAYFKHYILGHPLPFDRHDWIIVRSDTGEEQRYVIDYYYDESRAKTTAESAMPALTDREAVQSILVDVRPALDGVQSLVQRAVVMPMARRGIMSSVVKDTEFTPLPLQPTTHMKTQVQESLQVWENIQHAVKQSKQMSEPKSMVLPASAVAEEEKDENNEEVMKLSKEEAIQVASNFSKLLQQCSEARQMMNNCSSEDECAKASLALTMCMAQVVCPIQHSALSSQLNVDVDESKEKEVLEYNAKVDAALENVALCVQGNDVKVQLAKRDYGDLFS